RTSLECLHLIQPVVGIVLVLIRTERFRDRILPPDAVARSVEAILNSLPIRVVAGLPPALVNHATKSVQAGILISGIPASSESVIGQFNARFAGIAADDGTINPEEAVL